MIFNDCVQLLNAQLRELEKLEYIMDDFNKIIALEEEWNLRSFMYSYTDKINYASTVGQDCINDLMTRSKKYFDEIREYLIGIEFLEFGEILSDFKSSGKNEFLNETAELIDEFKKTYKILHNYKKIVNRDERVKGYIECLGAIKNMNQIYEKFKYMVSYINSINLKLNNNILEEGLEVRLLTEGYHKETYSKVVEPIYEIYKQICVIGKINYENEKLEIVRIETGSFFIKFLGNKAILKVVAKLFVSAHDILIRNYTREGKRANLVETTDLFKNQFDLLQVMKDMGLDVTEHEEIARETMLILMKQSNILLTSSPDIRINDKILSKSDDIKRILKKQEYKLLEEESSNDIAN